MIRRQLRAYSTKFLEFTPHTPKLSKRTSLYTGPRLWPSTDGFYKSLAKNTSSAPLSPATRPLQGNVSPKSIQVGDIVELNARNGEITGFGVVTFSLASGRFDYISASTGSILQGTQKDVSFSISGAFPVLPAKQYNVELVTAQLRFLVRSARQNVAKILPLCSVIHAQLAVPSQPRAIGFEYIHSRVAKLAWPSRTNDVVSRLSLYFAMAYRDLSFVRVPGSPFALASFETSAVVNKVMHSLTRIEFEHGVSQLMHNDTQSGMGKTLQEFLNHYILWNDSRLIRAVQSILESYDGRDRNLDSTRSISNVLSQLPNVTLFPWVPKSVHNQMVFKHKPSRIFTPNLPFVPGHVTCTLFDSQIACSYEKDTINVFLPVMNSSNSVLKPVSQLNVQARSTRLGSVTMPLLHPQNGFIEGIPRQALKLSLNTKMDTVNAELCEAVGTSHPPGLELVELLTSIDPVISDHELSIPTEQTDSDQSESPKKLIGSAYAQAWANRLAGEFLAQNNIPAPYLVTNKHNAEKFSSIPGFHSKIGVNAYVPIARPLQDSISLLSQQLLLGKVVPPRLFDGKVRPSITTKLLDTLLPQFKLLDCFEYRDSLHTTLSDLQKQLRGTMVSHIFRCTLLEDSEPFGCPEGQILKAFCHDINANVEVFVPARTEQVFYGDQVIGTEILELEPFQGVFVVSM